MRLQIISLVYALVIPLLVFIYIFKTQDYLIKFSLFRLGNEILKIIFFFNIRVAVGNCIIYKRVGT